MSGFWIDVRGALVHLMCYEAGNIRFCRCSEPVGKYTCDKTLRAVLEGKRGKYLSERAVWCKECGRKYPFVVGTRFCTDPIFT